MAVGDVSASGGIQQDLIQDRSGQIRGQIGEGVGRAIGDLAGAFMGYAGSQLDMELQWKRRADATEDLEVADKQLKFEQQMAEAYTAQARDRSANPFGFTNTYDKFYETEAKKFVETLPPRVQREVESKLQAHQSQQRASAFQFELQALDARDKTTLNSSLNTIGTAMRAGQLPFDDANVAWAEAVDKSALPPADKEALKLSGRQTLESLQFGKEIEMIGSGYGTTGKPADGSDVQAAGLAPQERALLNVISSQEAKAYNTLNGGGTFEGYADHPRKVGPGGTSTAAGRYQFIAATWDTAKASYERATGVKVPDFSPEWQDRVALHWAEVIYNKHNKHGLTFRQALMSTDPAVVATIRSTLGNPKIPGNLKSVEWEGLGDLHMSDATFIERFTGQAGVAGGGSGLASAPNPWTDPRFANLSLEQKVQLGTSAANDVAARQRQLAEQSKRQMDAELDRLQDLGASTGDLNYIFTDLRKRPDFTEEMERKYRAGVEEFQKKESSAFEAGELLKAGKAIGPQQMEGYRNWFGEEAMQGVASGDEGSLAALAMAGAVARVFPPGTREAIQTALRGSNRGAALEFMGGIATKDRSLLARSGFSEDEITEAAMFARVAGGFSSREETIAALDAMKANATGKDKAKLSREAGETFSESVLPKLNSIIADTWSYTYLPKNSVENFTLQADASQAYADGYMIYGTEEGATEHMKTVLQRTWGSTSIGSDKQLMRRPPENYYPPVQSFFGPSYDYLNDKVREDFGISDSQDFFLIPDATTDQEIESGALPTYKVWRENENGQLELAPGRWGGEAVLTVPNEKRAELEDKADKIALRARIDAAAEERNRMDREAAIAASLHGEGSPEANEAAAKAATASAEYNKRVEAAKEVGGYRHISDYFPGLRGKINIETDWASVIGGEKRSELIGILDQRTNARAINARAKYLRDEELMPDGRRYSMALARLQAQAEKLSELYDITYEEAKKILNGGQ